MAKAASTKPAAATAVKAATASKVPAPARAPRGPAATPAVPEQLALDQVRLHWFARQGLAGQRPGADLEGTLAATGWLRTLGGVDVYLAARARVPGASRADLDAAVTEGQVKVIPAVRGCIYLVPRAHAPLALRTASTFFRKRSERELKMVGVTDKELADLGAVVCEQLRKGPASTDGLRKDLPEGAIRSLGERGKKLGLATPLPTALRVLELDGVIERLPEGGRLDTERYVWRLAAKNVLDGAKVPSDEAGRHVELARVFFSVAAPATAQDFAGWSGLTMGEARAAVEKVGLRRVSIAGYSDEAFAFEEDLRAIAAGPPASEAVALLAFEDNFTVLHGGPGVLVAPEHHGRKVATFGGSREGTLGEAKHLQSRVIATAGEIVGFWEYDAPRKALVRQLFAPLPPARRKALDALAAETAVFLADDMGHARSYALDSMSSVAERARALVALGAT